MAYHKLKVEASDGGPYVKRQARSQIQARLREATRAKPCCPWLATSLPVEASLALPCVKPCEQSHRGHALL